MTTVNRKDIGYKITVCSPQGGGFVSSSDGPKSSTSVFTKSPAPVLGWKKLIRASEDATGGYTLSITNVPLARGSASISVTDPNFGGRRVETRVYGVIHTNPLVSAPTVPPNTADTQARIAFMKQVRKRSRSFQSGVFLGELRETIHQIRHPAQALRKAVSTYSREAKKVLRSTNNSIRRAKALSGTWLEHSYGWRPLFQDVDDAMKALAHIPRIIGDPVTGYYKHEFKGAPFAITEVCTGFHIKSQFVDVTDMFVIYKGLVAYENDNPAPDWKSNWGLTLSDFAPTVWELIPYSFLVDYFSNIGNVIDAACMGTVSLRWGFRTTFTKSSRLHLGAKILDGVGLGSGAPWHFTPLSCDVRVPPCNSLSMVRNDITSVSVGIADITVRIPGIDDWHKWANIAALAIDKNGRLSS